MKTVSLGKNGLENGVVRVIDHFQIKIFLPEAKDISEAGYIQGLSIAREIQKNFPCVGDFYPEHLHKLCEDLEIDPKNRIKKEDIKFVFSSHCFNESQESFESYVSQFGSYDDLAYLKDWDAYDEGLNRALEAF